MGGAQRNGIRRKVKITEHARQRLKERCPHIQPVNYSGMVTAARYSGKTTDKLSNQ